MAIAVLFFEKKKSKKFYFLHNLVGAVLFLKKKEQHMHCNCKKNKIFFAPYFLHHIMQKIKFFAIAMVFCHAIAPTKLNSFFLEKKLDKNIRKKLYDIFFKTVNSSKKSLDLSNTCQK